MSLQKTVELIILLLTNVGVLCESDCPKKWCECSTYPKESGELFSAVCDPKVVQFSNNNQTNNFNISRLLINKSIKHFVVSDYAITNFVNISNNNNFEILKLSNTSITTVPLLNMSDLQVLDLSRNKLHTLNNGQLFRLIPNLKVFNLSSNSIQTLGANTFANLTSLKLLDLSRNNLITIDDKALQPLNSLQYLNLSYNQLQVLKAVCFVTLTYLQQLDVSWNKLSRVAAGSLELPSLARLSLEGNPQLGNSDTRLVGGTGSRLLTVDASRTGLKQVPAALTHSIRTLRLAGNNIKMVSCGDLDSYPLLQLLDFTSNSLGMIEEDALGRLDSLNVLYLTDNNLSSIPRSLSEKLRVLHLEKNQITKIEETDLINLKQLEVLLLNNNLIKTIAESAFSQLDALVSLDLSDNPIVMLPVGCLDGPRELKTLKLSSLKTVKINTDEVEFPLTNTEYLMTLDLSSSPNLAKQFLSDTAALAAAKELQDLDLSSTSLSYIRSDLLHFLSQLRLLRLENNPLDCSQLQWLVEWMRRQDMVEYRQLICTRPAELWGTLLIDLQMSIDMELTTTGWINFVTTKRRKEVNKQKQSTENVAALKSDLSGSKVIKSLKGDAVVDMKEISEGSIIKERIKEENNNYNIRNIKLAQTTESITQKKTFNINIKSERPHEIQYKEKFVGVENYSASFADTLTPTTSTTVNLNTTIYNKRQIDGKTLKRARKKTEADTSNETLLKSDIDLDVISMQKATPTIAAVNNTDVSSSVKPLSTTVKKVLMVVGSSRTFAAKFEKSDIIENVTKIVHKPANEREKMLKLSDAVSHITTSSGHPGLLVMLVGLSFAISATLVVIFGARVMRCLTYRRTSLNSESSSAIEDIEIATLPGVTELW